MSRSGHFVKAEGPVPGNGSERLVSASRQQLWQKQAHPGSDKTGYTKTTSGLTFTLLSDSPGFC